MVAGLLAATPAALTRPDMVKQTELSVATVHRTVTALAEAGLAIIIPPTAPSPACEPWHVMPTPSLHELVEQNIRWNHWRRVWRLATQLGVSHQDVPFIAVHLLAEVHQVA